MSEPASNEPLAECANCGRAETRSGIRFCPNCGAALPGFGAAHTATGVSSPTESSPMDEPTRPILKPVASAHPTATETPRQPWDMQGSVPAPHLTGARHPSGTSKKVTALGTITGCLGIVGIVGLILVALAGLLFLGLLVICSQVKW